MAGPAARGVRSLARGLEQIRSASGPARPVSDLTLLHPVIPGKIVGIGLNYRAHAAESNLDPPEVPVVFAKFGSSLDRARGADRDPREETRPTTRARSPW